MITFDSKVEGKRFKLIELEDALKPLGYSIGGNWDYDHGSFDYQIDDDHGYLFLRLPFKAVEGELDSKGVVVELESPYVLKHKYEDSLDQGATVNNISAAFNQFQSPVEKDADVSERYVKEGRRLVEELESVLLS